MFQIVVDCRDARAMTRFWAAALSYDIEPPPQSFATWNDYWRSIGVPEDELDADGDGSDSIRDPEGRGPRIWFQVVPEDKVVKNRIHLDLGVSGGRELSLESRKERVDREVERLVAAGAHKVRELFTEGIDHYAVAMQDPEGNEFDVN
ncbi:MAG TPA: VOC family protein [Nocardioidaceae bacterium]|nr:VOC family protein [Nocardioidaceae bacterium]